MPIKYIPYAPEPIQGQAVLNNIARAQRVLSYRDNDKVFEKIQRGLPSYEIEEVEQVGKKNKDWNNLMLRGECLAACAYLKERGIKVDLVYIDPPFASGANYAKQVFIRRNPKLAAEIEHAEQKMELAELQSFEETMYGDIWRKEDYLNWMYENLTAIQSVMSDSASIYVHLDHHIGHYVKILLDEIFGEENFRNEISYGYRIQGINQKCWPRKHDLIFYYTKNNDYIFNPEKEKNIYEKPFIDTKKEEANLRLLKEKEKHEIIKCLNANKPIPDKYKNKIFNKYYSEVFVRDIWDCDYTKPIISGSSEYTYYATQKSEGLLTRIIKASSDEDMIVADFFGGSGVAAKVAHDLNRKFIHCDVGVNSLQISRDRLQQADAAFQILEVRDGVHLFRNPQQTMDKLAKLIPGLVQGIEGVGDFWFGAIQDKKLGVIPVYAPNLIDSGEKVLDQTIVNQIINEQLQILEQKWEEFPAKAIVYYVDIDDEEELKKFIRDINPTTTEIELRDLKLLLHDLIDNDNFEYAISNNDLNGYCVKITQFHSDRLQQKINEYNAKRALKNNPITQIKISENGLELIEWLSLDCKNASGAWRSSNEIKIDKKGRIIIDGNQTKEFWNGKINSPEKPLRIKIRNIAGDETIKQLAE
ncbi:DNA methyltransferase [Candidatus Spongiihabitans sp.]|uniref:DNA methyltransferase n=1 Tax=Candidatus Spongiihabitans sp. TaxID=3101308 RepID=UPI003C7AC775